MSVSALVHPRPCDAYLLWCQPKQQVFELRAALDWQPKFVDRLAPGQLPEKHLLFQQGAYDSVEFTALFVASLLLSLGDRPGLVFDLCAGTGSNNVFAWQLLQPKLLLANTFIRQHHRLLLGHLRRCDITPAAMMSVDSGVLAEVIPGTADLVIVDAPSSAQSVLARGRLNPGCFHPVTIAKYAKCQRRLLANASHLVASQGYLLYTTRTYSLDENEHILDCPFRRTALSPRRFSKRSLGSWRLHNAAAKYNRRVHPIALTSLPDSTPHQPSLIGV